MVNDVEQLLIYGIEKYNYLVLKCDGLHKNKNIPKKVANLIKTKYHGCVLISNNKKFFYKTEKLMQLLLVNILLLYLYYINIILLLYLNI